MAAVLLGASQSLPSEMKIDFYKNRLAIIWKHQVVAGYVDPGTGGKCQGGRNALLLQLRPAIVIKFCAPADIVVEAAAANPKIAHRLVCVDHHPKVFTTVGHTFLDKKRAVFRKFCKMGGGFFGLEDRKNRIAPAAKVSFEYEGIPPWRAVQVEMILEILRILENEGLRMADPQLLEKKGLLCLTP